MTGGTESLREFITRALASESTRVMAVSYLRAAAQTHPDSAVATNFDALADLYAHADGPYPEVEDQWWDMGRCHVSRPVTAQFDNMAINRVGV